MPGPTKSRDALLLDACNHVEKPLLDQHSELGRAVIALTDVKQTPTDTNPERFVDVMMPPVPRERRKVINWLENNQIEDGIKQLAGE